MDALEDEQPLADQVAPAPIDEAEPAPAEAALPELPSPPVEPAPFAMVKPEETLHDLSPVAYHRDLYHAAALLHRLREQLGAEDWVAVQQELRSMHETVRQSPRIQLAMRVSGAPLCLVRVLTAATGGNLSVYDLCAMCSCIGALRC